ncbi:MAG: type 4 prepilin-like proteins leader peptide-processing enzyme PilD [Parcubacteria group bacterium Greene0714_21]|nr:MAG: type 4 prepilin-like proteins leader peptide-processing enzyme PilD [Parcubacteria group bacterium Greene0416_39]TSC98223.1 MAG: type 4 prepilin-like proteins leader peptide-processing enzyme PilD [Parcubacteria group bacterium Greene1014_47]TSD04093.1 MAG: type 4 prepilin-like proteins leader peptide-processing enzyme PilD [Parcubacteria group bacterium Greene0714_21]
MISFAVFVFGLAIGSFLNAVIYRLERGESAFRGRSYCPRCKHTLAWHDLVPVVSFLFLQGKCRYCKEKISWQYPLVELATAVLFVLIFWNFGFRPIIRWGAPSNDGADFFTLLYFWFIAGSLIAIFVYDLKHFIIPDRIVFSAIGIAALWRVFEFLDFDILNLFGIWNLEFGISLLFIQAITTGVLASAFFFAIFWLSRGRAMGFGDVKLVLFMGLFLSWPNILVALFVAFFLGAVFGVFLVLARKKEWKSQVPFGPFLIAGTFIALFWGQSVAAWYLNLLLV